MQEGLNKQSLPVLPALPLPCVTQKLCLENWHAGWPYCRHTCTIPLFCCPHSLSSSSSSCPGVPSCQPSAPAPVSSCAACSAAAASSSGVAGGASRSK